MAWLCPIPKYLMPDRMTACLPDGDGGWRAGVPIVHVRFDRTQKVSGDAHRSADAGQGKVYVDAVNSIGAFEVPAGSRVVIGGHAYLVAECRRKCDFGGHVHHWELIVK